MAITIGSARYDEKGGTTGGQPGDQKQKKTPDTDGEVALGNFYVHQKGWYVMRPKDARNANAIASKMQTACNNSNLGYNQSSRLDVVNRGVGANVKMGCDCSSLVRACVKEGTGKDPGNFSTENAAPVLEASGLFEPRKEYTNNMKLYTGDVLVTKTKGHTAIVVQGEKR